MITVKAPNNDEAWLERIGATHLDELLEPLRASGAEIRATMRMTSEDPEDPS